MTLYLNELKINIKQFIIWSLTIGLICLGCITLFTSYKDDLSSMADSFSNMEGFSAALGMDQISISTMEGYFAAEVAVIYALGGAMFAALLFISILSKEEEGHTSEFLLTLPKSRIQVLLSKYLAGVTLVILFDLICNILFAIGFACSGESIEVSTLLQFALLQLMMHLEIGSICFLLSSLFKKSQTGLGLGLALILYVLDLVSRITPSMENIKYITPFSYCNATDIFSSNFIGPAALLIGILILILSITAAIYIYNKRDIAS